MAGGAIDIVCNIFTPEAVTAGWTGLDEAFKAQVRMDPAIRQGVPIDDYLRRMDPRRHRALAADRRARGRSARARLLRKSPMRPLPEICRAQPGPVFPAWPGIDPTRGMEQLRDLEQAVHGHGFVGAHFYPHWFSMRPDAAQIYPTYAKCCELNIPIMMQVGQNLIYSRDRRLPSVARPILLDQVAIDFPGINPDRHPYRHSLGRRNDRHVLEAREYLHRR